MTVIYRFINVINWKHTVNSIDECCVSVVGETCHWMSCWDRWLYSCIFHLAIQQESQTAGGCLHCRSD